MTVNELLSDGRLTEACDLQCSLVQQEPSDTSRLFLCELQLVAGQHHNAWQTLKAIPSAHPSWPASRRWYQQLVRAAYRRDQRLARPQFLFPPPVHARARRRAVRALESGDPETARNWIDRADDESPYLIGHLDGQEFEGLRDSDDRFASVLEVLVDGQYGWLPWEQIRVVKFAPSPSWLDQFFRPATIRTTDGSELVVVIPLIYPRTREDEFALGMGTDFLESAGPVCAVGAKLLFLGDDEIELASAQQLELRPA